MLDKLYRWWVLLALAGCGQSGGPVGQEQGGLVVLAAPRLAGALAQAPARDGPEPLLSFEVPHQQLSQNAPEGLQEELQRAVERLAGIEVRPTPFSLEGARGWFLADSLALGPADAFIEAGEFGHLHVPEDGSMHMLLPKDLARLVRDKRWGIRHPLSAAIAGDASDYMMVFGPRNLDELPTVWLIVQASYAFARGQLTGDL